MYWFILHILALVMAYPGMKEERYQLLCPDGTVATDKVLHACCGATFDSCILCARIDSMHLKHCALNRCNGTLMMKDERLACIDCHCHDVVEPIIEEKNLPSDTRYHGGCPFLHAKQRKEL